MSASASVAAPRAISDRLLGVLGIGMIVLAVVVLFVGGPADSSAPPLAAPPPIALLEPAAGAEIIGPLAIVFTVQQEMERKPSGWGVAGLHLHLGLDGLELMPGPTDIQELGGGRYRWNVGALESGEHTLRLFWSDERHAPVEGGGSTNVEVTAR